ncbi:hypothetical protein ACQEWB_50585 [Streptomyces sp. CA-249302]|uniref:hypothetical protein n=1 Tax=Streptomyces sp. CA-249302 TaxID=3240058 RepID=UPI003D91E536
MGHGVAAGGTGRCDAAAGLPAHGAGHGLRRIHRTEPHHQHRPGRPTTAAASTPTPAQDPRTQK